jgi:MarR family
MVLLSAQGMDVPAIAKVAFTSEDRVRDVIRNFNAGGFGSLYPKYKGGHPPKFTLIQRGEIKKIAKARPAEHDLPFFRHADRQLSLRLNLDLLQDSGLTIADHVILAVLSEHPTGRMSAQELSASLEWEKSQLSHQVRRVEHLGLIARERKFR